MEIDGYNDEKNMGMATVEYADDGIGRDYRTMGNAEGVSRIDGESLRQKGLLPDAPLERILESLGSPKGKLHTYFTSCLHHLCRGNSQVQRTEQKDNDTAKLALRVFYSFCPVLFL